MHKSNRKTPRGARKPVERTKVRVNIRLYADDVARIKERAAADEVDSWQSWLRRHISRSLARLDKGRIV